MKLAPQKWRPTLTMIVVAMLGFVLILPLGSLWLFRFYDGQLVKETEAELIAQGAFLTAIVADRLDGNDVDRVSSNPLIDKGDKFTPVLPQIELSSNSILPPRPDARSAETPIDLTLQKIGNDIEKIVRSAQKITLAGFRLLDANGIVVLGSEETGLSLAHVPEVSHALSGKYASNLRERVSENPTPPIYSISRGTNIRVFVAMPISHRGKVVGVAYLSRTPSHFLRELYAQRWRALSVALFVLGITLAIAFTFIRTIKGPIDALNTRSMRIAEGDRAALMPLNHHGTREIASLSQNLVDMAEKLQARSDYIDNFARHVSHELKSPLTSTRGAAELLLENSPSLTVEEQKKFLGNILDDTGRMATLLGRLRDLAQADNLHLKGKSSLKNALDGIAPNHSGLKIEAGADDVTIPLSPEAMRMVFSNLLTNAENHSATRVEIQTQTTADCIKLSVSDNGSGISPANREKIFELFFTTRRDDGGTGMGLGIVQSIVKSNDGQIRLKDTAKGACFEITLPV